MTGRRKCNGKYSKVQPFSAAVTSFCFNFFLSMKFSFFGQNRPASILMFSGNQQFSPDGAPPPPSPDGVGKNRISQNGPFGSHHRPACAPPI